MRYKSSVPRFPAAEIYRSQSWLLQPMLGVTSRNVSTNVEPTAGRGVEQSYAVLAGAMMTSPRTKKGRLHSTGHSSRRIHNFLCTHGIQTVIPEQEDHKANHKRKFPARGRPLSYDAEAYKCRHIIERSSNTIKQWPELAARHEMLVQT